MSLKPISRHVEGQRLPLGLYDSDMNDLVSTLKLDPYKMIVPINCSCHCPTCRNRCEVDENEVL